MLDSAVPIRGRPTVGSAEAVGIQQSGPPRDPLFQGDPDSAFVTAAPVIEEARLEGSFEG
jgi:hypothetical protein